MTDTRERAPEAQNATLLVAHATAHLVTGESFDLMPFTDENDVKSKVSGLMTSWADSGFLLRGQRVFPWHQVRTVEVTSVEEVPELQARQRLLDWEAANFALAQQSFWKTKKAQETKGEKEPGKKG